MDIHYTLKVEVDGNEVFSSTYLDTASLQEDLGKAEGAVEVFIDEINEIEPMEMEHE